MGRRYSGSRGGQCSRKRERATDATLILPSLRSSDTSSVLTVYMRAGCDRNGRGAAISLCDDGGAMRLSIRYKIMLLLLPLGLLCLALGGALGYRAGDQALTASVERELTAQREMKKHRVEAYLQDQLRFTSVSAHTLLIADASKALVAALKELRAAPVDPAAQGSDSAILKAWYGEKFAPRLEKVTGAHIDAATLLPTDPVARRLQAEYIVRNPNPIGEKDKLLAAPRGDAYDEAHGKFHARIKQLRDTFGFYDINLVDPATGDVFYTVAKETDFLSNINNNPFGRSGFTTIVERALDPRNGGAAVIQDYTAYPPSAFEAQLFTAMPVIADGQTIAVLVAQIDVEGLDKLLTDNKQWRQNGAGESGEVQMVGEDHMMRSQSRFLQEDPQKFLALLRSNGMPEATLKQIEAVGSTILYLPIKTDAAEQALHNKTGFETFTDVRGQSVLAAYGPLEVAGLRYALVAKKDVAEAREPVTNLRRDLLTAAAIGSVALTLFSLACASLFTRPIRKLLVAMAAARENPGGARMPVVGSDEFAELERSFNAIADELGKRDSQIATLQREKDELYRSIYPEGLAERLLSSRDTTAETIPNVTVAVCFVEGLETLGAPLSATEARDRLNALFDVLRATAIDLGVEPVRSLGESYIVVCGLSSARVDHADRTLEWSRAAAEAVSHLGAPWARSISLRFGVASGEIDVLLFSAGHTPFDVWGRTLGVARLMAIAAAPDTVQIDQGAHSLLTNVEGLRPCPPIENAAWGAIATWSKPLSDPPATRDAA
jgi:class 3 adenylate cyclase